MAKIKLKQVDEIRRKLKSCGAYVVTFQLIY